MKPAAYTALLLLLTASARAQLTLLPQIGIEMGHTCIQYNGLQRFSPAAVASLKAGIRLDYRLRGGHGPYLALGTTPAPVTVSFDHPSNALAEMRAHKNPLQWKVEGGYQYTSRPIQLGSGDGSGPKRSSCSPVFGCGAERRGAGHPVLMRLQPSLGLAYRLNQNPDITFDGSSYSYNSGNWKTALVAGLAFEFAKDNKRMATVSVSYMRGLGNLGNKTIEAVEAAKPTVTIFRSYTSSWGLSVGLPIGFSRPGTHAHRKPEGKSRCGSFHHCRRILN